MINESVEEVESPGAVAGITCDIVTDLVEWMRWAHERNRPFTPAHSRVNWVSC